MKDIMKQIETFSKNIHELLNKGMYSKAIEEVYYELGQLSKDNEAYPYFLTKVAGLLIDIGTEGLDKKSCEEGIGILKNNEVLIKKHITEDSYYYCLGNGIQALYRIGQRKKLPNLEEVKTSLSEAKNFYYKAFKMTDLENIDDLGLQILTNLGNNLSLSGRIIEAINLHRRVLRINPHFPQSLIGFAESLDYLNRVSANKQSIWLYSIIYHAFKEGIENYQIPVTQKKYFESQLLKYKDRLIAESFKFSEYEKMKTIYEKEFDTLSHYRKFCIEHFLCLNEHSIYCSCSETSIDNLSIIHSQISLYGTRIGKLELLLNRLKSEFGLARKLIYEGINETDNYDDIDYSDLMDFEVIGQNIEKVRTSFRLCFGILDKIAHGIIYFFELPKGQKEPIYFEKFWDEKKRWDIIKDIRNPHLVALYSIANDLNGKEGEFHFYKQWRNKLEHNNLILVDKIDEPDLFELFDDDSFISRAAYPFFKEQSLHLLQMCGSAIYSYVYAVRTESLKNLGDAPTIPFIIQPKVKY